MRPLGVDTTMLAGEVGKVSVSAAVSVAADPLVLPSTMVNCELAPDAIDAG